MSNDNRNGIGTGGILTPREYTNGLFGILFTYIPIPAYLLIATIFCAFPVLGMLNIGGFSDNGWAMPLLAVGLFVLSSPAFIFWYAMKSYKPERKTYLFRDEGIEVRSEGNSDPTVHRIETKNVLRYRGGYFYIQKDVWGVIPDRFFPDEVPVPRPMQGRNRPRTSTGLKRKIFIFGLLGLIVAAGIIHYANQEQSPALWGKSIEEVVALENLKEYSVNGQLSPIPGDRTRLTHKLERKAIRFEGFSGSAEYLFVASVVKEWFEVPGENELLLEGLPETIGFTGAVLVEQIFILEGNYEEMYTALVYRFGEPLFPRASEKKAIWFSGGVSVTLENETVKLRPGYSLLEGAILP